MFGILVSAATVLFLDHWTKTMIESRVPDRSIAFGQLVRCRYVSTRRTFFQNHAARNILILIWFAAFTSAAILSNIVPEFQHPITSLGLGAALGGAAGNLLEILRKNRVTDFIDLGWWPVFNLADTAIVVGLIATFVPAMAQIL